MKIPLDLIISLLLTLCMIVGSVDPSNKGSTTAHDILDSPTRLTCVIYEPMLRRLIRLCIVVSVMLAICFHLCCLECFLDLPSRLHMCFLAKLGLPGRYDLPTQRT
jgi:hypothetical protein